MENAPSTGRLRILIAVAVVALGAVIWATTAFATGGSSNPGNTETSESPAAAFVQDRGGGSAEDCPEREGGSEATPDL
jgi:ABC-type transporter Mla subunit MlaD